jgi:hypothetical protein
MRKKNCFKIRFFIFFLLVYSPAQAQVDKSMISEIQIILNKPSLVYNLNSSLNDTVFIRIDKFFNNNFELGFTQRDLEKSLKKKRDTHHTLNKDVKIKDSGIEVLPVPNPVYVDYNAKPHERSFTKKFRKPTNVTISDEDARGIATKFIIKNNFVLINGSDKLGKSTVISRKLISYDSTFKKKNQYTILTRVIFKREFQGKEVINSKQIVDIYPGTKEIISYKTRDWIPVDEKNGKKIAYKSIDQIASEIEQGIDPKVNMIEKMTDAFFQTEDKLIPVLLISIKSLESKKSGNEMNKLIIFLPSKLDMPKKSKVRLPHNAK